MNNHIFTADKNQDAWVVFSGDTDIHWLKILKPGFRHCFILLNDGLKWMSIDPLSPYTDIQIYHHIEASFSLPEWLKDHGYLVSHTSINRKVNKAAPWMFCTCVESIKRILGIHNRFIFTPWQLYRHLNYNKNFENI
mgnify:CR=1 FL=1